MHRKYCLTINGKKKCLNLKNKENIRPYIKSHVIKKQFDVVDISLKPSKQTILLGQTDTNVKSFAETKNTDTLYPPSFSFSNPEFLYTKTDEYTGHNIRNEFSFSFAQPCLKTVDNSNSISSDTVDVIEGTPPSSLCEPGPSNFFKQLLDPILLPPCGQDEVHLHCSADRVGNISPSLLNLDFLYANDVNLEEDLNLSDDSVADPNWVNPEDEAIQEKSDSDVPEPKIKKRIKTKRWHKKNEEQYDRNLQKKLRSQCLPYLNYKKKIQPPKAPKPNSCNCKLNCNQKITPEDQLIICQLYWKMGDYKRQKDFILSCVKSVEPKRRLVNPKRIRTETRQYFFKKDNTTIRVCEKFFKGTLNISNGPINTALASKSLTGTFGNEDNRGKHEPVNKTKLEDRLFVMEHIDSFPRMESHLCRSTSSKEYLDEQLSIPKMYELYLVKCEEKSRDPVSVNVYRRIFCTEFNIGFHKTKKDQCLTCHKYLVAKTQNSPDLREWEEIYRKHIELKTQSQEAKQADKVRSNNDETFMSITIDLQKIMHMPHSNISLMYYLRKINVYNATIYESRSPNDGYCYIWNELNGNKGSAEVGTALYLWVKRLPEKVKEITIFSDTCAGQNRNQYLMCLLLYLVQTTQLDVIEQKYLESGHSHMEVDSMHSAIESQMKYTTMFCMNDYCNIIKLARSNRKVKKGDVKKKPYIPIVMQYNDILDLKGLAADLMKNRLVSTDGEKVMWLKVKCFRYEKGRKDVVLFRYDFTSDYKELLVTSKGKNILGQNLKKRQKKQNKAFQYEKYELKHAYSSLLPITKAKKNDLIKMCSENIIPVELHHRYQNLPERNGPDYIPGEEEQRELLEEELTSQAECTYLSNE